MRPVAAVCSDEAIAQSVGGAFSRVEGGRDARAVRSTGCVVGTQVRLRAFVKVVGAPVPVHGGGIQDTVEVAKGVVDGARPFAGHRAAAGVTAIDALARVVQRPATSSRRRSRRKPKPARRRTFDGCPVDEARFRWTASARQVGYIRGAVQDQGCPAKSVAGGRPWSKRLPIGHRSDGTCSFGHRGAGGSRRTRRSRRREGPRSRGSAVVSRRRPPRGGGVRCSAIERPRAASGHVPCDVPLPRSGGSSCSCQSLGDTGRWRVKLAGEVRIRLQEPAEVPDGVHWSRRRRGKTSPMWGIGRPASSSWKIGRRSSEPAATL